MKLIEYLPDFLQDIVDFKELFNTEDQEVEKLLLSINSIVREATVQTAESYGLERYEKIYNIKKIAETVEARRVNILLRMNSKVPYTFKWLINKLNTTIGESNYSIDMNYDKYTLTINVMAIYKNIAKDVEKALRQEIPANLILKVDLFQTEEMSKYFGGIVHIGKRINIKQEVL